MNIDEPWNSASKFETVPPGRFPLLAELKLQNARMALPDHIPPGLGIAWNNGYMKPYD